MNKATILFLLIVIGFCFAQDRGSFGLESRLMASRRIYVKSAERLALCDNTLPLNYHFNYLMLQTKSETLQIRRSFWKQAGIYGLEFAGAECGSVISGFFAYLCSGMFEGEPMYWNFMTFYSTYIGGNILLTSTCTQQIGKLMKRDGRWWRASLGAGLGAIIGICIVPIITGWSGEKGDWQWHILYFTTPALGSVIGFNL